MTYCRVRLSFVAPSCGLLELAIDTAELKRWLVSVARLTPAQKADLLILGFEVDGISI